MWPELHTSWSVEAAPDEAQASLRSQIQHVSTPGCPSREQGSLTKVAGGFPDAPTLSPIRYRPRREKGQVPPPPPPPPGVSTQQTVGLSENQVMFYRMTQWH